MVLTVRPVPGAVVRELRDYEIERRLKATPRRERTQPGFALDTVVVRLPRIRAVSGLGVVRDWTFPTGAIERSRMEPIRLNVPRTAAQSYWLVGSTVHSVSDLDVTADDVAALLAVQEQRRAAILGRAHAAAERAAPGTHQMPSRFSGLYSNGVRGIEANDMPSLKAREGLPGYTPTRTGAYRGSSRESRIEETASTPVPASTTPL